MNIDSNERAREILILVNEYHDSLTNVYEFLVDSEKEKCKKEVISLIIELKELLKSIDHDF
jgi:hypothetical protein